MRAIGLEPRVPRTSSTQNEEGQIGELLVHNYRGGAISDWRERWRFGKVGTSNLSDSRKLKVLSRRTYRPIILAVGLLVLIFMPARINLYPGAVHELSAITTHRIRNRERPDPCSSKLPDTFEEFVVDDSEIRGLRDGKLEHNKSTRERPGVKDDDQPQGASLLELTRLGKRPNIGLLNIDQEEAMRWQNFAHGRMPVSFPVTRVNESLQWSDLYPEWIDENELYDVPECPPLPMPCVRQDIKLDLVVARIPCQTSKQLDPERDIRRLQLLLSASTIAIQTGNKAMNVLITSECRPLLNLFPCGELLGHQKNSWLYHVNLSKMRRRLALPLGSCELSLTLYQPDLLTISKVNDRREAYVSMVHTDSSYVCGAIVLAHSIRLSGSTRDLVILVDASILPEQRRGLEAAGWKVREIERIRNPYAQKDRYNEWNYSKFRLWQLTEYDKIVFIDSDLLVLRNIDFLFALPEISATGNDFNRFNSGVMVIEPSNCTFGILMDQIMETRSYNGGDQGYLNEMFPWWHRVPKYVNFLKFFWSNDTEEFETKTQLFSADPPDLYVIHYLGLKPWLCFRDYDCNWNLDKNTAYASDVAHATWFRVHDSMPESLQRHCWLRTLAKAAREVERSKAEAANQNDEHWKIKIKDPRLEYCSTLECDWGRMVRHWDEPPPNNTVSLSS